MGFPKAWIIIVGSAVIGGGQALSCYSQSLLPSGSLPEKLTPEDWSSSADLAVCKDTAKWCIQYYIEDQGNEYVSGGCEGGFIGSDVMPVSCNRTGFATRFFIPGMFGSGGSKLASFYCCDKTSCIAPRRYPDVNGRGVPWSSIIPLILLVVPSFLIGGLVDYLRIAKE